MSIIFTNGPSLREVADMSPSAANVEYSAPVETFFRKGFLVIDWQLATVSQARVRRFASDTSKEDDGR